MNWSARTRSSALYFRGRRRSFFKCPSLKFASQIGSSIFAISTATFVSVITASPVFPLRYQYPILSNLLRSNFLIGISRRQLDGG
ncbi:hypothetical protein Hanom_Chr01g00060691 [Helianthus anomalus]